MRKILVSPDFGAGWSTWMHDGNGSSLFALTYQPIIDALDRGEKLDYNSPSVVQFVKDYKEKFGTEPYTGGLGDLEVREVSGRVHIREYDGSESVIEESTPGYYI